MIVETGPNGSTSWIAEHPQGSSLRSRIGSRKEPPFDRGWGVEAAGDDPRARGFELGDLLANVLALRQADQRAHPGVLVARVADLGLARAGRAARPRGRRYVLGGRQRPSDRGAFLPRLDRHLHCNFADEQVEFWSSGERRPARGSKR
jgi:hypothetical protein